MSDEDTPISPDNGGNGGDNVEQASPGQPGSDIVRVFIEDEMRHSYLGYAMSVIIGRALPDIRDGLKPVHRRCLFGMDQLNNRHDRPTMKSARVAGEVVGKYHPHGEMAIYDTIVHMAQDFKMRYPLVDGQGNFGSIDGDPAAASRYTEVRMTRFASMMLADLDKETVDMGLNYDDTILMPLVLPTRVPNLLVNGAYGIAVAMATNIPPHNLGEVIDACVALVDDESLTVDDLMEHVKGPDFPTAGIINGRAGIVEAYRTGRGRILVRARATIEEEKSGRETIIVTEIPFQLNKAKLVENIADLVREKRITGISDLRDESSKEGMRIVIEVTRGEPADVVLNNLYTSTPLQSAVSVNCVALDGGQPKTVNLKDMLMAFVQHRRDVVVRRSIYQLREARRRAHTLEGQAVALADIDEVVELIRNSESRQEAQTSLTERSWLVIANDDEREERLSRVGAIVALLSRSDVALARKEGLDPELGFDSEAGTYRLSEEQADAILTLQLHRLVSLEQSRLISEYEDLIQEIREYQQILDSDERLNEVIKEELVEVKEQFGDERKTEILETLVDLTTIDMIVPKTVVVTISHVGYAKIQSIDVYETQHRGGKGKIAAAMKEDDFVEHLLVAHNHSTLLCFSSKGRVYQLPAYQIPESSRNSLGRPLVNMLPALEEDERISAILPIKEFSEDLFVVMATEHGYIKRVELTQFRRPRKMGLIAINLNENDRLIGAEVTDGQQEIVLVQDQCRAVKFMESDVRVMGRQARGVRGLRLRGGAQVLSLVIPHEGGQLLCATENGYGKRTALSEFRRIGRGGLGVYAIGQSERNGRLTGAIQVMESDEVMLINNRGKLIRTAVEQIRSTGRAAQGVRLIKLGDDERLIGISRIAESALNQNDSDEDDDAEEDASESENNAE